MASLLMHHMSGLLSRVYLGPMTGMKDEDRALTLLLGSPLSADAMYLL